MTDRSERFMVQPGEVVVNPTDADIPLATYAELLYRLGVTDAVETAQHAAVAEWLAAGPELHPALEYDLARRGLLVTT